MFGGLGGALKGLTSKAEEMMEKTKKNVEELAAEKKAAAAAMLEGQGKKTVDALSQGKADLERGATDAANDAKKAAVDGFDQELAHAEAVVDSTVAEKEKVKEVESSGGSSSVGGGLDPAALAAGALGGLRLDGQVDQVQQAVDGAIKQVGTTVDTKIKETDQFLDEKREQVVQQVQNEANKATESAGQGMGAILGKAKGLLNF